MKPLFVPHRFPGPFQRGKLVARPNRFLAIVDLEDGRRVSAHLGDRGRLASIVVPGAEVHLSPAPPEKTLRKTAFSLVCIRCPSPAPRKKGPMICLDPAGANRLARAAIEAGLVPPFAGGSPLRSEIKVGSSRFDFGLDDWLIEVKNVGVAEDGVAMFPDAPSIRASKHASELARLSMQGIRTMLLFVTQRPEVVRISPHPVDPEFARQLALAREAGVMLAGVAFAVSLRGFSFAGTREVSVDGS